MADTHYERRRSSIHLSAAEILVAITVSTFAPTARGQTFELLHSFQNSDGAYPQAGLVQGSDGNFYGTTVGSDAGPAGLGTVFMMTPAGELTTLVIFGSTNGYHPHAGLVQGNDGDFYGTTQQGDLFGGFYYGTVFRTKTNGLLTTLVAFNNTNGANPLAGLVQASDGNFYGTTQHGGTDRYAGTVFKMATNGTLTSLVTFSYTNGNFPQSVLVQGRDGRLYGTTSSGDTSAGTVFKVTTNGGLTTLVLFNNDSGLFLNGAIPRAGLVQGSDGHFYGTTSQGGTNGDGGTLFRMTTNGVVTRLVSFTFGSTNGAYPKAGLVEGNDGHFYGTTSSGGTGGTGTVFRMTTNGTFTTLVSFNGTNGGVPLGALVQGRDGNLYGTTSIGGTSNYGTVFRIVLPSLKATESANKVVLSWTTNAVGFTLQTATNLSAPIAWIDSTDSPVAVGAQFKVTNTFSDSARFYRLRKP